MTPKERSRPELLNAKRKIRVAKGSGVQVQEVNRVLKMHKDMAGAMKQLRKMGGMKGLGALFGKGGLGGGGMGGLGGAGGMGGLPGLGGGGGQLPGLGGGGLPGNLNDLLKK